MCRYLILFLLVIMSCDISFAEERHSVINYPIYQPQYNQFYNPPCYYKPHISPDNLSALEKYSMNRTYNRDYPKQRLERLEEMVFGSVQQGDFETRYKNVESAILSRPGYQMSGKKSLLSNLANYFAGQTTGYTPPIYPNTYQEDAYGYPAQGFSSRRYDQFSNGIFGGGYRMMNQNFGNGSSVRILP